MDYYKITLFLAVTLMVIGMNNAQSSGIISGNHTLSNPPFTASIFPGIQTLNATQSLSLKVELVNGKPPYEILYSVSNSSCGSLNTAVSNFNSGNSTTVIFTPNITINSRCTEIITATAISNASSQSSGLPMVTSSAYSTLTIKPVFRQSSNLSISLFPGNKTLNTSVKSIPITAQISGESFPPYIISFSVLNTKCGLLSKYSPPNVIGSFPSKNINITMYGQGTFSISTLFVLNSTLKSQCNETIIASVSDGESPPAVNSTYSNLTINTVTKPKLNAIISPMFPNYKTILDANNQPLNLTTKINGTNSPFSISYSLSNSKCGSLNPSIGFLSLNGSNLTTFTPNYTIDSQCFTRLTANITDNESVPLFALTSTELEVNPSMQATILPTNLLLNTSSNLLNLKTTVIGGTSPFYLSYSLSNDRCGKLNAKTSKIYSSSGSGPLPVIGMISSVNSTNNLYPSAIVQFTPNSTINSQCVETITANITDSAFQQSAISTSSTLTFLPSANSSKSPLVPLSLSIYPANETITKVSKFIPINMTINGGNAPFNLTYSLSNSKCGSLYFFSPGIIAFPGLLSNNKSISFKSARLFFERDGKMRLFFFINQSKYAEKDCAETILANVTDNSTPSSIAYASSMLNFNINTPINSTFNTTTTTTIYPIHIPFPIPTPLPPFKKVFINNILSSSFPIQIVFPKMQTSIIMRTSSSALIPVSTELSNITSNQLPKIKNYSEISALDLNASTSANLTINVTESYPCNIPSARIKPFELENGTWVPISPFTTNASSCKVLFAIPKDPAFGLFEENATNTTISSTTVPTTISTTINATKISNSYSQSNIIIYIIVVIIVIIVLALIITFYLAKRNKIQQPKPPI
jgi:hypothetical protein